MKKNIFLIFLLLLLTSGSAFADDEGRDTALPKNTFSVDVGKTAFLLLTSGIANITDFASSTFIIGTAIQYERLVSKNVGLLLNYEYGMFRFADDMMFNMQAHSVGVNWRYYFSDMKVFFLEGALGYAHLNFYYATNSYEINPIIHYFKFGGKLGWKIDFNKPGGFVLEPAIGLYGVIGKPIKMGYEEDMPIMGRMLNILENIFVWGLLNGYTPFSLSLGYRF